MVQSSGEGSKNWLWLGVNDNKDIIIIIHPYTEQYF